MVDRAPHPIFFCGFLAAMTFAVYWPVSKHQFLNFDDEKYVTQNTAVLKGLNPESLRAAYREPSPGGWPHPLAILSHMLDVQLYGLKPSGHHLTNVFLHLAAAIFLFLALGRMTADPWRSAFVAAVFAVHPLQVESVAWVAERKNVLNGAFFMMTLWAYAGWVQNRSPARYAGVLAAFVLSLLAKSVVVSLPVLLLLLDFWPLARREPLRQRLIEKIPFFAFSALCAYLALNQAQAVASHIPFAMRAGNAMASLGAYLAKAIWPQDLCVFYPYPAKLSWLKVLVCSAIFLAMSAASVAAAQKRPWWLVGWLWFLVSLVPFLGLIQVGAQAMADRYAYLALVGLALAAAWGLPEAWALGAGPALCALMIAAGLQLRYWQDGATLFIRAMSLHPESAAIHENLANAFYARGEFEDAVDEYAQAIAIDPAYTEARNNFSIVLFVMGRRSEAIAQLEAALKTEPDSDKIRHNLEVMRSQRRPRPQAPRRYR